MHIKYKRYDIKLTYKLKKICLIKCLLLFFLHFLKNINMLRKTKLLKKYRTLFYIQVIRKLKPTNYSFFIKLIF